MKTTNRFTLVFYALIILFMGYVVYSRLAAPTMTKKNDAVAIVLPPKSMLTDSIVSFGAEFIGTPYVYAGTSPNGFDCSGFIYYVFKNFGIEVPRSTSLYTDFGSEIPIEQVQKGDLVLFLSPTRNAIGHIGIVSNANGAESDFIHATSGKQMSVVISNMATNGYKKRFVKAIRVAN